MIQCPYCPEARPQTGNRNIFRHLWMDHPETPRGRAIALLLCREPLPRSWTPRSPSSAGKQG